MTICKTCEAEKREADFYASNRSTCKDCVKARVRHRARINPMVQKYDQERSKTAQRKEQARRIAQRWRKENPDAYRAQTAVGNAVRDGKLKKEPCMFCGSEHVHAHHRDYAKPLDVLWLCPKCHRRLHGSFPETEGANKRRSVP